MRQYSSEVWGEGYGQHDEADVGGVGAVKKEAETLSTHHTSFTIAMIPLVLVIALNAVMTYFIFPSMDFSGLQAQFPDLNIAGSLGLWSIIISLVVACTVLIPLIAVVAIIILGTMFGSF